MTKDEVIAHCEAELELLRHQNLVFQDALNMKVTEITDPERLQLLQYRIGYQTLLKDYSLMCEQVASLTGRDPRLPIRSGD